MTARCGPGYRAGSRGCSCRPPRGPPRRAGCDNSSAPTWRTQLAFDAPAERDGEPLRPTGKPTAIAVGADSALHPVDLPKGRELVRVRAAADVALSLSIEAERDGVWRSLASDAGRSLDLVARRIPGQPTRLRLTSLDGRAATATLTVDDPSASKRGEGALAAGLGDGRAFASLGGLTPGLFRVAAGSVAVCARPGAPCERAPGVVALDAEAVLVSDGAALVRADLTRPVPIDLSPTPRALGADARGLIAVEVRSATGLPGAAMSDGATAPGDGAALALGTGEARLSGDGVGRVRVIALTRARQPWDRQSPLRLEIPPGEARDIPLGRGADALEIALERGLVARSGGAALWADRDSARGLLPASDALIVANPSDRSAFAEVRPHAPLPTGTLERFADRAGRVVVAIPKDDGRLRVAGATLRYARADGIVLAGDDLPVGPGGFATLEHDTGHVALWREGPAGPWPSGELESTRLIAAPGVHRVHVQGPFVARIRGSGPDRVLWRPEGGPFDVVASERAEVEVRALGGGAPSARIESAPAPAIGEGVGPEVLLDAGGVRWFRFEVLQAGPIGFGVRASADRVTARVHTADGAELASGVVGRVELAAGSYLLALTQPSDAAPVRARPALVGVDPPDTGPPGAVVDAFVRAGGAR